MPFFFYSRKSKSWFTENPNTRILKLGSTTQIEYRKWTCSTDLFYPSFYEGYLEITSLGKFPNVISLEKTIFRHPFFASRRKYEGAGEEFFEFDKYEDPLQKAAEIIVQYDTEFSIVLGDKFLTKPKIIPKEKFIDAEPLNSISKQQTDHIEYRQYQNNIVEKMIINDKGRFTIDTGGGKTAVYAQYIKKEKFDRYLIIVPTTKLVSQTIETCKKICGDSFSFIKYEKFLTLPKNRKCVVVGTYQNSHNIEHIENIDCIIFDECHCTVVQTPHRNEEGNIDYSEFQKLLKYPCKKKFFGTATEKNLDCSSEKLISMDDETIYGKLLDKYDKEYLITNGYLTDYTFDITCTIDKKQACLKML